MNVRFARLSATGAASSSPGPVVSGIAAGAPGGTKAGAVPGEPGRSAPLPGGGPGGPGGAADAAAARTRAASRLTINADHLMVSRGDPDVPGVECQSGGNVVEGQLQRTAPEFGSSRTSVRSPRQTT